MTYYSIPPTSDELYHYGIKGMKWGVRRYENEDGTLTEAGKKRYGTKENYEKKRAKRKKIAKAAGITAATAAALYGASRYGRYRANERKRKINILSQWGSNDNLTGYENAIKNYRKQRGKNKKEYLKKEYGPINGTMIYNGFKKNKAKAPYALITKNKKTGKIKKKHFWSKYDFNNYIMSKNLSDKYIV